MKCRPSPTCPTRLADCAQASKVCQSAFFDSRLYFEGQERLGIALFVMITNHFIGTYGIVAKNWLLPFRLRKEPRT